MATLSSEVDPREVAHIACDCVPDIGPEHCHLCSERAGHPVPWSECSAQSAPLASVISAAKAEAWDEGIEKAFRDASFTLDGLLEQNPYRASIEQTEAEDDNEMCQRCSGTGLGQREGGHCTGCDGTGIAGYHWAKRGEERW